MALKAFVKQHPSDPLTGNAQYWLGETYFARNQYMEAAAAFADGYKRAPKGPKAPETLLDLGRSLARAEQKKNACPAGAARSRVPQRRRRGQGTCGRRESTSAVEGGWAPSPLTLVELDARLASIDGFEPRPLVAVATSGGPDSLALAILADRWARGRGGVAWALTVDHRLRPESGAEAQLVAGWMAGAAFPTRSWHGAATSRRLGFRRRRARRYRLLGEWCAARGCSIC